ncbi:unnamed protein product, partial [Iphiclides podalirius]
MIIATAYVTLYTGRSTFPPYTILATVFTRRSTFETLDVATPTLTASSAAGACACDAAALSRETAARIPSLVFDSTFSTVRFNTIYGCLLRVDSMQF